MEVSKALKIIQTDGPARGLHVNVTKTEVFWPSLDPRRDLEGVFPVNIGKPSRGVKLLWGPVSLDMQYCSEIVQGRVDKTLHLWEKVQKLHDPQSELLLLRSCSGVSKLYFMLRTTAPLDIQSAAIHYDSQLMLYLRHLVVGYGDGFGLIQQRLATLPIKDGGFGIYTFNDTGQYCFLASCAQTQHLQQSILKQPSVLDPSFRFQHALQPFTQVCGLSVSDFSINDAAPQCMKTLAVIYFGAVKERIPTNFSLTEWDLTLWHCNRTPHAMDFLKAIPIHGINQAIAPRQFRSVLIYRLGIPLFSKDSMCSSCNKLMDVFGDHAVHCAGEVGQKFRHDLLKDVLADMCYKAGVVARKEVSLDLSSNNANSLRPADILVYNWEDGKDVCMDVTGVSPFTSARTPNFTLGHAISAAITRKRDKYLETVQLKLMALLF
ncbi:uncharacterized protein LOC113292985 isoform X1 [Papaver somniferum]|uniref:uncharacterized protein LOC113292985 isoform X1 n=1 Tax=Papaver somniferum TaxID=3469 RepID=UPI000E6F60E1|nr:uncharacterized protein LOC113292985 isoform X1 [Papaver somniferum]